MKTTLDQLRCLIKEAYAEAVANTQMAPPTPASLGKADHPALQDRGAVNTKVNQVVRLFSRRGHQVDVAALKRFVAGLDPHDQLVMTADEVATAFLDTLS